ncbi:helicase-related protein [Pedobacter sp. SYSU D00535]|uniref:helicase-related protein n=1 Tax=Pedobacter sp. SYSU D00535 TaxID=2810308 RepID=UPI001A97383D|nr:helicase-related protein [Pedobacter sp. SYSU D00535]
MRIIGRLDLIATEEGGRINPIYNGYRPTFRTSQNQSSDCVITILNSNYIRPGESERVEIKILHPSRTSLVTEGSHFTITEGLREVARGVVISIQKNRFKIGELVSFNGDDAEVIELSKVFGVEKAQIKLLRSGNIIEVKVDQLEEQLAIFSNVKIRFLAIAAKIKAEIANQAMIAPLESNIIPLPHQILALEKVMNGQSLRFLIADEVGMGKTIETGLILKELKLRGIAKRTLIVVPKSAMGQWQQEMKKHFNELFHIYDTEYINTLSKTFARLELDNEINLFTQHNQIIVSMDALRPIETRQGWSKEKVEEYNRYRIHSVLEAEFDLLVIDECHKVGGSNMQVGRFQMADVLCNAIPNVLLLSATPHRGKSDHFRRILQLLNADAFAGEGMPTIPELEPYVVRTEKRQAVDYNGKPLFNKRHTKKIEVVYDEILHRKQKALYTAVTEYVVNGFNLAQQTKNTSYGFVMILFQRMMSSSTQAILDAMQKRADRLSGERQEVNKENIVNNMDEFGFEGQMELDFEDKIFSLVEETRANYDTELSILQGLVRDAKDCLDKETDAKVAVLLNKLMELKRIEQNPDLKFLIFTEFTSTQFMLQKILEENGGYICEVINGSMDFDQRVDALKQFKESAQVLICTDAAGESLNMQFAHIVINYDMPWNPMVLEQRIGRVDRIGQSFEVLALNMMLDNSVDKRVYEVVETKLTQIMNELGIDKTSDVLDSTLERDRLNRLYLTSLLNPAMFEQESNNWLDDIKSKLKEYRSTEGALPTLASAEIKADKVEAIKHSPLPKWLEGLTKSYLQIKGIGYKYLNDGINFKFPGHQESIYTFNIKESVNNPIPEPISLQHEIIQTILKDAIHYTSSQRVPIAKIKQGKTVAGIWSLWHLEVKNQFETNQIIQPIFISLEGENFSAFAQSIWDKLVQETDFIDCIGVRSTEESKVIFSEISQKAEQLLQYKYEEFENSILQNTEKIRSNKEKSFAFQEKQMNRIGIENIRQSRLSRLYKEKEAWESTFSSATQVVPSLSCLLMVSIEDE